MLRFVFVASLLLNQPIASAGTDTVAPAPRAVRLDAAGDPLPSGAVSRLGSARFRTGHETASALSPDGKTLAAAGPAGITLLDIESGRSIARLPDEDRACLLAYLDRGNVLAAVGGRGRVRFWSVASGTEVAPPLMVLEKGRYLDESEVAASANGRLVVWNEDGIAVWDLAGRKRVQRFTPNEGFGPVAISPDGRTVAALDQEWALSLWDADTGKR